jgi:hypothetical protein
MYRPRVERLDRGHGVTGGRSMSGALHRRPHVTLVSAWRLRETSCGAAYDISGPWRDGDVLCDGHARFANRNETPDCSMAQTAVAAAETIAARAVRNTDLAPGP